MCGHDMYGDSLYATEGSCALEPERAPRLRAYEGGAGASGADGQAAARPASAARTILLAALALVATVALALGVCAIDAADEDGTRRLIDAAPEEVVTVEDGDSLWSIAEEHHVRGASTGRVASWIRERNGLAESSLEVGDTLTVPVLQE